MSLRTPYFFRGSPDIYESARSAIDLAFDYPSGRAVTAFPSLLDTIKDAEGFGLVSTDNSELRDALRAFGFEEVSREYYFASMPIIEEE